MLNLLADVFLIATGHRPTHPKDRHECWEDRFPPRQMQDRGRSAYQWFNPGRDRNW